ncbi:MAG: hypothetical protein M1829_001234 [Trizodia sp. TS-e1964]|nr:MAG: hypothetical protein M1829_001234 [Trizodia sp. TS-e1964]
MALKEEDGQFASIWATAVDQYFTSTNINRYDQTIFTTPSSAESLMQELDAHHSQFTDFRAKRGTLFSILMQSMKPVELVGNMAAGAASGAAKGVSAAYDSIIELFSTLQEYTKRLEIYLQTKISGALRLKLAQILAALLEIYALSAKLIHDGRMKRIFMVIILGGDKKVAAAVTKLDKLMDNERGLAIALTLTGVGSIQSGVDDLKSANADTYLAMNDMRESMGNLTGAFNSLSKKIDSDENKQQDEKIRLALRPEPTVQEIYDGLEDILEGSCKWIHQEPAFIDWKNLVKPLLFLSGLPGSGKSYLSYHILQHLEGLYPQRVQDPSRISVAYFFCKDYNPNLRSFNTLLRTVAYQITKNDPVYAKHVAAICSFPDDIRSTRSLWKKLFSDFFRKIPVYIIIDGLDESFREEREDFLELLKDYELPANSGGRLKIQIMFVGRPELCEEFDSILEPFPLIEISAKKNTPDINDYIHFNIRKSKKLRKISTGLRQEILEKLSEYANGMFLYVNLMIKEIQSKDREDKIIETLKNLPKGLVGTLRHVLERFSEELDEYQIDDLNEMLAWVTCARRPLTLGELQTILKLKSADGLGMIDLESKLRRRYASFFVLMRDDGKTTEEFQAHLKRLSSTPDSEDEDSEAPIDPLGSHQNSEVIDDESEETDITSDPATTIVRMSHASLGDFFRSKDQQAVAVGVNINNAELMLAKSCLASLCDESKYLLEGAQTFNFYAATNFQTHLSNVEISTVKVEDKLLVFNYLKELFHGGAATKRWGADASLIRNNWLYTDQYIAVARKWLTDADVEKSLDSTDAAWVKEIGSGNSERLLKPLAMVFATEFLQDLTWEPTGPFLFIHGYLEKVHSSSEDGKLPVETALSSLAVDRFYVVAKWPQFEKKAIWHARLGKLLREGGYIDEAINSFEKAISLDDTLGLAFGGLGISHGLKRNYKEAINSVLKAQELLQDPKFWHSLVYHYRLLAEWSKELDDYDEAVNYYAKFVALDPWNYDIMYDYLDALATRSQYKEMTEFLLKLDGEILQPSGNPRLIEMLLWFADAPYFNKTIRTLARETKNFQQAESLYKRGIRAAKIRGKEGMPAALRHWLAFLYFREMNEEEKAVHLWNKVINDPEVATSTTEYYWIRLDAAEKLSMVYFNRALDNQASADNYVGLIEDLTKAKVITKPDNDPKYSLRNTTLVLGAWYRLKGREQDARACFKEHVALALDILTDDDEDNDIDGWYWLASVLIAAGEDKNANAALSVLQQWEPEESDDEKSTEGEETKGKKAEGKGEEANQLLQREAAENKSVNPTQDIAQNIATLHLDNPIALGLENSDGVRPPEDGVPKDEASPNALGSDPQLIDEAKSFEIVETTPHQDEKPISKELSGVDASDNTADGESPALPEIQDSESSPPLSDQPAPKMDGSTKTDNEASQPLCDGPCEKKSRLSVGFYFCRFCIDIGFCENCIKIVRAGEMPFNLCHPKHEHFYYCGGPDAPAKGTIKVAGEIVPLAEWLESVRKEWAD